MERLGALLSDPVWWMSAVVVALAVSVAGNFATRWTERGLSQFSERWRKQRREKQKKIEKTADWLMRNHSALVYYEAELSRYQNRALVGLSFTVLWFGTSFVLASLMAEADSATPSTPSQVAALLVVTSFFLAGCAFWISGNTEKHDFVRDSLRIVHRRLEEARLAEVEKSEDGLSGG